MVFASTCTRRLGKREQDSKHENTMSRLLVIGIVVALLAVLPWVVPRYGGAEHAPIESASLRLKWVYDPGFAGELVAAKGGIFARHGLNVEIRPGGFEADPIKFVASGSDTFGVAGADSYLLAVEKGIPLRAFAAGYLQTPVVFYVRGNTGIDNPTEFLGKRVGYQAGQDTATVYEALLRKLDVDRSKITEVPVKYDFSVFESGAIDVWPGYAATQSYILQRDKIPYRIIPPAQFGLSYLGTVYFARASFIDQHPQLVQKFVDSLIEGWEHTYGSQDHSIPLIQQYDPAALTPDLIRFNLDTQKPYIKPDGMRYCEFSPAQWTQLIETLHAQGLLATQPDLQKIVSFQFLQAHYAAASR